MLDHALKSDLYNKLDLNLIIMTLAKFKPTKGEADVFSPYLLVTFREIFFFNNIFPSIRFKPKTLHKRSRFNATKKCHVSWWFSQIDIISKSIQISFLFYSVHLLLEERYVIA